MIDIDENLLCPEAVSNPHAYFGRLRESDPVHWNPRHRAWVITRYADVMTSLRSPSMSADRITPFAEAVSRNSASDDVTATMGILQDWMVFRDPPDHTRLRGLVSRAFAPPVVKARHDDVQHSIDELISELREHDRADVIREFAYPLPAIVIAQMLGAPPQDRELFKTWSDQITALVFGDYAREDRFHRGAAGMIELRDYLLELIADFERTPGDNLISLLLEREGDDALTRDELVATCVLLLFGGHETTTNLIGNAVLALLTNPNERERLRATPDLAGRAIEEFLRFDGPARATVRMVREDHELGGVRLQAGDRVFLVNMAANRDPDAFADPDRLDLARNPSNHLGFGFGAHYCLGAPLARLEGQLAITSLIDAFPDMRLEGAPEELTWHRTMLSRGLEKLPVSLR